MRPEVDHPADKASGNTMFLVRPWASFSIATRGAVVLSVAIGAIFAIAAAFSYQDTKTTALAEALAKLDSYNKEVVAEQEHRFEKLAAAQRHATELLQGELAGKDRFGRADLDRLYPKQTDGSRRTSDALFSGTNTPLGYIRGIGGFVGLEPTLEEGRILVAATLLVHAIGEGLRPDLKSMTFFTPRNALVMFAPDRPDKLLYYRRDAPADLNFNGREFLDIVLPKNNPKVQTRCTSLQPILYDKTGQTWTTGCMTPIYVEGHFIGAWGNSILLDDLLATGQFEALPGADVILISREGRLIRHPQFTKQNTSGTERYLDLNKAKQPELRALWNFVRRHPDGEFVGSAPELGGYVAMRRITTPGWYAVTIQRDSVVLVSAERALTRVLTTAAICLVLQGVILFFILRWRVGEPLRRLMEQADQIVQRVTGADGLRTTNMGDEVEQLTSRFALMGDEVLAAHAELEARVAQRTHELAVLNDELRILTETDPLTGLANRRRVMTELYTRIEQLRVPLSVIMFDVDQFKRINDTQGHLVGDQVLRAIARRAEQACRSRDIAARIGGEEFLIVLPRTRANHAYKIAERLREAIATDLVDTGTAQVRFTVSLGVASATNGESAESVLGLADEALYEAKRRGGNTTRLTSDPFPSRSKQGATG